MNKSRPRRGLTLIEVAVTMAALALVLGQVVPALKDARSDSLLAGCQDRMGRIAAAGLIYASEDANELAIPVGRGDRESIAPYTAMYGFGGKSGLGVEHDARTSPFGGVFRLGAMDRPLNTILYKERFGLPPLKPPTGRGSAPVRDWNYDARLDVDVYHCPADSDFPGMHYKGWKDSGLSGYDYFGASYMANSYLVGSGCEVSPLSSNSAYYRPVSRIPNPAAVILYQETAARYAIHADNPELDQAGGCWPWAAADSAPAYGWHGTPFHFVTARADGHTAWTHIEGFGRQPPQPVLPPGSTDTWLVCVIVRGPGWQIDTLPAPFIDTWKIRTGCYGGLDGAPDSIWDAVPQ